MNILRWMLTPLAAIVGAVGGSLMYVVLPNMQWYGSLHILIFVTAFLAAGLAAIAAAAVAPSHKRMTALTAVGAIVLYGLWGFLTDGHLGRKELDLFLAGLAGCMAAYLASGFVVRRWGAARA